MKNGTSTETDAGITILAQQKPIECRWIVLCTQIYACFQQTVKTDHMERFDTLLAPVRAKWFNWKIAGVTKYDLGLSVAYISYDFIRCLFKLASFCRITEGVYQKTFIWWWPYEHCKTYSYQTSAHTHTHERRSFLYQIHCTSQ